MVSSPRLPTGISQHHPLGPLTTLEVGGKTRFYAEVSDVQLLRELCGWADCMQVPILPLGEGSNLLVSDQGFQGLTLRWMREGVRLVSELTGGHVLVRVEGGTIWDAFVAEAVANDWAGVECLSGIPGCVGASPIQNIGAYGQEVCETIHEVEALDRSSGEMTTFTNAQCQFAYRHSIFKGEWKDRFIVTAVTFRLHKGGRPELRYGELSQALAGVESLDLQTVREAVLRLRRSKSMVRDLSDPNHRSAGSFFMNPIVTEGEAIALSECFQPGTRIPTYPAGPGRVKLSAAWLIENSGFPKGYLRGRAGLSTNHVLALTNRGGATAQEIVELAATIRKGVLTALMVKLEPEAQFVGFDTLPPEWDLGGNP